MDILNEVLGQAMRPATSLLSGEEPRPQAIAKLRYTHEAMVDLIIANPAISQNELARTFGFSAPWVSRVLASDAFQLKLAERSKEMVDPELRQSVELQFKGLVLRSLEILQEKLDRPAADIPDNLALRALEVSSRAAGYGAKQESPPPSRTDVHLHLESLGGNLVQLLQRKKTEALSHEVIDVEAITGG